MKFYQQQMIELRNGQVTFIKEINVFYPAITFTYPIITGMGHAYSLKGELRVGETNPKDIIGPAIVADGTEFTHKNLTYIVYNNTAHKFEKLRG